MPRGLAIVVLIQGLSSDPPEQFTRKDAQQRPCNIQGLYNCPRLIWSLQAKLSHKKAFPANVDLTLMLRKTL